MNIVILYGRILTKIEFNFFYNSKAHISVATFQLILNNKIGDNRNRETINVKAYDDYADTIYRDFKEGDFIGIVGYLNNNDVCVSDILVKN